jgi:hypothetical protein
MALSDFYEGTPVSVDPFNDMIEYLKELKDQTARVLWVRRSTDGNQRKDSRDGDNVQVIGFIKIFDTMTIREGETDKNVSVNFPVSFSKQPAMSVLPIANKPLMASISSLDGDGAVVSVRSVGATTGDIDLRGLSIVLVGPKATA